MATLFRRRYVVTLFTSEPDLDLRDEVSEALMEIHTDSLLGGTVEIEDDETKVSDEEADRAIDAADVGFAAISEEDYAELQKEEGE